VPSSRVVDLAAFYPLTPRAIGGLSDSGDHTPDGTRGLRAYGRKAERFHQIDGQALSLVRKVASFAVALA